jgi:hypothetical protein
VKVTATVADGNRTVAASLAPGWVDQGRRQRAGHAARRR